jgi:two-component system chemotaxis response regulator CheB
MDRTRKEEHPVEQVRLLIVDDSLVFRRFLGDIFADCPDIAIVGEAENGINALDLILRAQPDVILLDLEMPLMDGMTALQHLMIHRPTPTIMFSSLSAEGTARCFDTMKNGAVDFVCKDFIFHKESQPSHRQQLIDKVRQASRMNIRAREPFSSVSQPAPPPRKEEQRVVFCEECGGKQLIWVEATGTAQAVNCSHCGDVIDISQNVQSRFRRNTFITVIGGGDGCFFNLLEIVPQLSGDTGGALIAVIHQNLAHVDSFAEYLDAVSAMDVIRAREGLTIEGGNCYIASGQDYLGLKPFATQPILQKIARTGLTGGPFDFLLTSVSTLYKKRAAGVVLSGGENDGQTGMGILIRNGGTPIFLSPAECFCKEMARRITAKCHVATRTASTPELVEAIRLLHGPGGPDDLNK